MRNVMLISYMGMFAAAIAFLVMLLRLAQVNSRVSGKDPEDDWWDQWKGESDDEWWERMGL